MNGDDVLRAAGVRVTPIRQFLLARLQDAQGPVTVAELLASRPARLAVSGATAVRRSLEALVAAGIVQQRRGTSAATYQLRGEGPRRST